MRRTIKSLLAILSVSTWAAAGAAVPAGMNYQGYLTDADGVAVDGNVVVTFSIYAADLGGVALWSDAELVTADQGLFSVVLGGPGAPFPAGLFETPLWLGVTVDGDTEMLPRRPLTTVGFSFKAEDASTLQGQEPAAFDQSGHVGDMGNPHAVTSQQVDFGRQVVVVPSAVDTSSFKSITVDCPAGKVSIAGGGRILFAPGSGSVGQAISRSYPGSDTSWTLAATSPNTPSGGWQLVGYAVCANL